MSPQSCVQPGVLRKRLTGTAMTLLLAINAVAANQDKAEKKALEKQAKSLVAEGKGLELLGQLREARTRFTQAQSFWDSKEAQTGAARINELIRRRTGAALKQAHSLYNEGKFKDAAAVLQQAANLDNSNSVLAFDLAVCYKRLGETALAIGYLDQAVAAASDPKRRLQLREWRTELVTGERPVAPTGKHDQLNAVNRLMLDLGSERKSFPGAREPVIPPATDAEQSEPEGPEPSHPPSRVCESLKTLSGHAGAAPSVVFNQANCAQISNQPATAVKLLRTYLATVPQAADAARVRVRIKDLEALAELPDSYGEEIRKLYAGMLQDMGQHKYDSALLHLEKASTVAPGFAPTQWRQALIHEGMGHVENARQHFTKFLELESSPEVQEEAKLHLETIAVKRAKYDSEIESAEQILSNLINRALNLTFNGLDDRAALHKQITQARMKSYNQKAKFVGGFAVPFAYAQEQLAEAAEHLAVAKSLFPLAPEVNDLIGFVTLQAHDGSSAIRAFDAVASQKLPVAFYAELRGHKQDRAVKCEITRDHVQLIFLASYGKNGKPTPPAEAVGQDGLGDLVMNSPRVQNSRFESLTFTPADIKKVETKDGHILLKLAGKELTLSPICLPSPSPTEGPAARRFANNYTRLFVRYAGLEDSKLGAEGLTGYEKVKLGYHILDAGMQIAMMPTPLAIPSDLKIFMDISKEIHGVMKSLQVSYATWERTVQDEEGIESGEQFKIIPTTQTNWVFLEELK